MSRFSGLMSRWTMPWSWAHCSASHTGGTMLRASFGVRRLVSRSWRKIHPIHEFHQQVVEFTCLAEIMHSDDIRMIEQRERMSFLFKSRGELWIVRTLRREEFQRDEAIQRLLSRLVNHTHTTATEAFENIELRKVRSEFFRGEHWDWRLIIASLGWLDDLSHEAARHRLSGTSTGRSEPQWWHVLSGDEVLM